METNTRGASHTYKSSGVSYWCEDCKRAHVNAGASIDDAPDSILGERGTTRTFAYAWCERERAYHYGYAGATSRIFTFAPTHHWPMKERASGAVRVTQDGASAFVDAYNAARTRQHMTRANTRADIARAIEKI